MTSLEILLIIATIGLLIIVWNLMRKTEILEEELLNNDVFLTNVQTLVTESFEKIGQVDSKYSLENDEVIGFVYKFHKEIIGILNEYFK
jgi:hypothetical protein